MFNNSRCKRALAHAHNQWNGLAFIQPSETMRKIVRSYFKSHQIVYTDNEIIVTDVGFVMMAIHTDRAVKIDDALLVPGIDSEGARGHLVLRKNSLPFHSLHCEAADAYFEAQQSQQKARVLLSSFGSKNALDIAVLKTPWYAIITEQDFERSGLCRWGADSFLRRYGLNTVIWRFGLPRFLLFGAGSYGNRAIAANLLRATGIRGALQEHG